MSVLVKAATLVALNVLYVPTKYLLCGKQVPPTNASRTCVVLAADIAMAQYVLVKTRRA